MAELACLSKTVCSHCDPYFYFYIRSLQVYRGTMDLSDGSGEDPLSRDNEDAIAPHPAATDFITPTCGGVLLDDSHEITFSSLDLFTSLRSDVLSMFGQRGVNINQLIEQTTVVQSCCRKATRIAAPHATVRSHRRAVGSTFESSMGQATGDVENIVSNGYFRCRVHLLDERSGRSSRPLLRRSPASCRACSALAARKRSRKSR